MRTNHLTGPESGSFDEGVGPKTEIVKDTLYMAHQDMVVLDEIEPLNDGLNNARVGVMESKDTMTRKMELCDIAAWLIAQ